MVRKGAESVLCLIMFLSVSQMAITQSFKNIDPERKMMVEKMDKTGLRFRNQAIIEKTGEFLKIPQSVNHLKDQFTVAKTAPEIEFVIIPNEERYQLDPPEEYHPTVWSSWGQGIFSEITQTYYLGFGNHRFHEARLYLVEYNAKTKTVQLSPEINKILGRELPNGYGDAKIHGWLNFYNETDMYFCTYWAHYPEPLEAYYQTGYDGCHIMSYNINTKEFKDFGVPMPRYTWPYHHLDAKRGLLYAVGFSKVFLCYDIDQQKVRFAGFPPDSILWNNRAILVNEETGLVYCTNMSKTDKELHFIEYNPVTNRFKKMKSTVPPNEESGLKGSMRAHTRHISKDGWFIGITRYVSKEEDSGGQLFKFYPDEDRVEKLKLCWPGIQRYTTSIALSPDEKYLYYLPGAHGRSHFEGCPVVQYNVQTGERKVLAFLFPYFYDKYGYIPGGSFSVDLDKEGKRLFVCLNGLFLDYKLVANDIFGDPSILVIHIPESERK
jgi:hypothetical protein